MIPTSGTVRIRPLDDEEMPAFGPRIAALERNVSYPLGADRFTIDHGRDYFAFFRRLGTLSYLVATGADRNGEDQVLAVLAATERDGTWYLGDLKVFEAGRGLALAGQLLRTFADLHQPGRCYGISMNPRGRTRNPVVRLLGRMFPEVSEAARLNFYSLDARAMQDWLPCLVEHRGPVGFLSLNGIKDIVLASTTAPMPLLHAQFGRGAEVTEPAPRSGSLHMFCTPAGDPLDSAAITLGLEPMASATILSVGMPGNTDWSFILTSDI